MDRVTLNPAYDLVSLLIGVNDEYRGRSAGGYRYAFRALLAASHRPGRPTGRSA
jgi:hypothetical protein